MFKVISTGWSMPLEAHVQGGLQTLAGEVAPSRGVSSMRLFMHWQMSLTGSQYKNCLLLDGRRVLTKRLVCGSDRLFRSRTQRRVGPARSAKDVEEVVVASEPEATQGDDPANKATADSPSQSATSLALLISPFFFWGTSMVAMKALSPHTAPLFVSTVRLLPAGAVVLAWAALQKRPQPSGLKAWLWICVFSIADGTCFQGFLAEGLQRTSAGLGSIIIDSQPLSVALLASLLFGERLTGTGYAGLAIGLLGLCLLEVSPDQLLHLGQGLNPSQAVVEASWQVWNSGEWWMFLAAQSMAVGTILLRYVSRYADPVVATGYHMLLGGIPLLLLSFLREQSQLSERLPNLTGTDLLLLAYVSLLGSAASYGVFFLNASKGNLTALSSLTFLTPLFAAVTGYLTLGDTLTLQQLLGASITLGGVYFISRNPASSQN